MSGHPGVGGNMMGQPANESLQISVPNSAVGAIIGAGGANIKQIMRESGAFVNVSMCDKRCNLHIPLIYGFFSWAVGGTYGYKICPSCFLAEYPKEVGGFCFT